MLGAALALVLAVAATGAAGARSARSASHLARAKAAIQKAISYEKVAMLDAEDRRWPQAKSILTAPAGSAKAYLAAAVYNVGKAGSDGEIDSATQGRVDGHLQDAEAIDKKAANAVVHKDENSVKLRLTQAHAQKETALAILAAVKPVAASSLTSPAGSGPITVTNVKCYANGTGGNAERDADFSVKGALWHLQEVYPATYVPGGSATKPVVFIEDMASPYNEPGIHIYAGFGVTVSGDVSTISSGQQVSVSGSLVDANGNAVAGSKLSMSFKCP